MLSLGHALLSAVSLLLLGAILSTHPDWTRLRVVQSLSQEKAEGLVRFSFSADGRPS
jgi:hypothetical protein